MGIISNKEVPLPESWDWELLEELLDAADQGGDSAGGAWGRWRREGGDRAFWDMCVKGRVDPSSHVVPIILRILSVLETGSMPKVLANKWSKFHSLSIAVKELLKIQYAINCGHNVKNSLECQLGLSVGFPEKQHSFFWALPKFGCP